MLLIVFEIVCKNFSNEKISKNLNKNKNTDFVPCKKTNFSIACVLIAIYNKSHCYDKSLLKI